MPDQLSFDLKQLVRICLNDPELRAEIAAALDAGPLPIRTPIANVRDGEQVFAALVRTSREQEPGRPGFIVRDSLGWLVARLSEVVTTAHDSATMSADQIAEQLGVSADELKKLK